MSRVKISIGRAPDCRFPIFNPTVLDYHAELVIDGAALTLLEASKGTRTWIQDGGFWIPFHKGPVGTDDVLRLGRAAPVQVGEILRAVGQAVAEHRAVRQCAICNREASFAVVSACGKCAGVLVAALSKTELLLNPQTLANDWANGVNRAQGKVVRCLDCATIFSESLGQCPGCGRKLGSFAHRGKK